MRSIVPSTSSGSEAVFRGVPRIGPLNAETGQNVHCLFGAVDTVAHFKLMNAAEKMRGGGVN